MNLTSRDSFEK